VFSAECGTTTRSLFILFATISVLEVFRPKAWQFNLQVNRLWDRGFENITQDVINISKER
jgi:hypothetical protein